MSKTKYGFVKTVLMILFIILCIDLTGCLNNDNETLNKDPFGTGKNEKSEVTNTREVMNHDEYPDSYYIKWAVPESMVTIEDSTVSSFNEKLKADGYDFGLKLIRLKFDLFTDDYINNLYTCGADIVFTGIEKNGNYDSVRGIEEGKFECLNNYLEGSALYSSKPEVFWEKVLSNGNIFLIPSENSQEGMEIMIIANDTEDTIRYSNINSEILAELEKTLVEKESLYYGLTNFDFVRCFGYWYDSARGIVFNENGIPINPFEDEKCITWMKTINRWYNEGKAVNNTNCRNLEKCFVSISLGYSDNVEEGSIIFSCKYGLYKQYKCSTGILSDSDKKEKAFKLIELLRTDHRYGNLLIYGNEGSETKPEVNDPKYYDKLVFGIDDGLMQVEGDGLVHFSTEEERKIYYDENTVKSPALELDFPLECSKLVLTIESFFENNLMDKDLEKRIEEYGIKYREELNSICFIGE